MKLVLFIVSTIVICTGLLYVIVPEAKRDSLDEVYIEIVPPQRAATSQPTSHHGGGHHPGDGHDHGEPKKGAGTPEERFRSLSNSTQMEFRSWLLKSSKKEDVQGALAIAYFSLFNRQDRDVALAKKNIDYVLQKEPNNFVAWRLMGYFHINNGMEIDKAIEAYRKSVELRPDYGEAHYALSFALATQDLEEGEKHFRKALELGVEDERELGKKYYTSVDLSEYKVSTLKRIERSLSVARQKEYQDRILSLPDSELKENLRVAFLTLFQPDRQRRDRTLVREKIQAVLQKEPKNAVALRILGYLYIDNGFQVEKAIDTYQKVLEIEPEYGEVHYALAFSVAMNPDLKATVGVKHFKEAMRLKVMDERNIGPRFYPEVKMEPAAEQK